MKTSNLIRSLFSAIIPAIMTIALVGCGGSSGDDYPTRGSLNTLARDSFTLVSPSPLTELCSNPTFKVQIKNEALGNVSSCNNIGSADQLFSIVAKGGSGEQLAVSAAVGIMDSATKSCTYEFTRENLDPGSSYYLCGRDDGLSLSRGLENNCYEFSVANPATRCTSGSFFKVNTIAGKTAVATAIGSDGNIVDGDLPFDFKDFGAVTSLVLNLIASPVSVNRGTAIPVIFNRSVNMSTVNSYTVKVMPASLLGWLETPIDGVSINAQGSSQLNLTLPSNVASGKYMIWIHNSIQDISGARPTSSSYSRNVSYVMIVSVK